MCLAPKALLEYLVMSPVSKQDLDRDSAISCGVTGTPDFAHSPSPEEFLEAISPEFCALHRAPPRRVNLPGC